MSTVQIEGNQVILTIIMSLSDSEFDLRGDSETRALKVYEQDYWMEVTAQGPNLKITLILLKDKSPTKISRAVEIEKDKRELAQFESAQEILKILRNKDNYKVNLEESSLNILWKVCCVGFVKPIVCKISLFPQKMDKFQRLEIQNLILKRKLSKYEQPHDPKDAFSPRIDLDQLVSGQQESNNQEEDPISQSVQIISSNQSEVQKCEGSKQKRKVRSRKSPAKAKTKNIKKNSAPLNRGRVVKKPVSNKEDMIQLPSVQAMSPNRKKSKQSTPKKCKPTSDEEELKVSEKKCLEGTEPEKAEPSYFEGETAQLKRTKIGKRYRIEYSNGSVYIGELKNELYHGRGILTSKTNGKYEGEWVDGKSQGKGETIDSHNNRHEGLYFNDKKHGWGIEYYANGEKYEGDFENDFKQGLGKYWFMNGDTYEGRWNNNECEGSGTECYADGSFYHGEWHRDDKHGNGTFTDPNGVRFSQLWDNGVLVHQKKE